MHSEMQIIFFSWENKQAAEFVVYLQQYRGRQQIHDGKREDG